MSDLRSLEKVEQLSLDDELTLSRYRREGERLGQKDLPSDKDKEVTDFERNEIKEHIEAFEKLADEVSRLKKSNKAKIDSSSREIADILPQRQMEVVDECNAELDKIEADLGPKSAVFEDTDQALKTCSERLSDVRRSVSNRELQTQFTNIYLPFMVALSLAEVAVNRLAFELFFEGSPLSSILLAIAVGAVLIFFAHVTGETTKRALPKAGPGERVGAIVTLSLLNVLVAVFVYYLAKMRQAFVSISSAQEFSVEDLLSGDDTNSLGAFADNSDTFQSLIATNIGEEGLFLLLVNVVIYATGSIAAFLRHDSHPDYEKLTRLHYKLNQKRVVLKKRYETRKSEVTKRKKDKLSRIQANLAAAKTNIRDLELEQGEAEAQLEESKADLEHSLNVKIEAFRHANRTARSSNVPKYFREKVTLDEVR